MTLLLGALLIGAPAVPAVHAAPVEQVELTGPLVVQAPVMAADEVPADPATDEDGLFQKNKPLAIAILVSAGVAATVLTAVVAYVGVVICCLCYVGGYYY